MVFLASCFRFSKLENLKILTWTNTAAFTSAFIFRYIYLRKTRRPLFEQRVATFLIRTERDSEIYYFGILEFIFRQSLRCARKPLSIIIRPCVALVHIFSPFFFFLFFTNETLDEIIVREPFERKRLGCLILFFIRLRRDLHPAAIKHPAKSVVLVRRLLRSLNIAFD